MYGLSVIKRYEMLLRQRFCTLDNLHYVCFPKPIWRLFSVTNTFYKYDKDIIVS